MKDDSEAAEPIFEEPAASRSQPTRGDIAIVVVWGLGGWILGNVLINLRLHAAIAYVLDEDDTFAGRCNMGLVDIKPLHRESIPDLKGMLKKHLKYTGSTVVQKLLDNWEESLPKFKRVMPRDYARVLKEQNAREIEEMSHVPE